MKRVITIAWTALLVAALGYLAWQHFGKKPTDMGHATELTEPPAASEEFSVARLKKLLNENDHVMLVISTDGCLGCLMMDRNEAHKKYGLYKYNIDRDCNAESQLVAQALYVHAFPSVYILDKQGDIRGAFFGSANIEQHLDSIIVRGGNMFNDTIRGVPNENLLPMLNHSFRSALAYIEGDRETALARITQSRKLGSYVFNNYMLYKLFSDAGEHNLAAEYRGMALDGLQGIDIFVNRNIIGEIDPENPLLELLEPTRLRHDHDHDHAAHHH